MKWFANLNTSIKLLIGFGFCLALMAVQAIFAINRMAAIQNKSAEITSSWLPSIDLIGHINADVSDLRRLEYRHILTEMSDKERLSKKIDAKIKLIGERMSQYEAMISSKEERTAYNSFKSMYDNYVEQMKVTLAISKTGDIKQCQARVASVLTMFNKINETVEDLTTINREGGKQAAREAATIYDFSRKLIVALVAACIGIGLTIGLVITRQLTLPLGQVVEHMGRLESVCITKLNTAMQHLADGDLTVELQPSNETLVLDRRDELGVLAQSFNRLSAKVQDIVYSYNEARESLANVIASVAGNAEVLASASEEFAATSQHMGACAEQTSTQSHVVSSAAEEVSSNVQTVAAGTEELNASVREIARNASEAARVASNAVDVTNATNQTMTQLGQSSQEIGGIIKTITAIAEQTNLLALNATIEAARAGESGKGFAVVAGEVKALAKETAKATEDISQRIGVMQADAQAAQRAIEEVTTIIQSINDFQNTIASAVEEQSATTMEMSRSIQDVALGASEIASNMTGVAQGAQATAAGASQTQLATTELARMAAELRGLIQKFHYEEPDVFQAPASRNTSRFLKAA